MAWNRKYGQSTWWAIAATVSSGVALAEEPRSSTEPEVLQAPAHFTDVADGSPRERRFDLRVALNYSRRVRNAKLLREVRSSTAASEGLATRSVGTSSEKTERLSLQAELGVFQDLALRLRLPVVLGRTHDIEGTLRGAEQSRALWGSTGSPLFQTPFRSPARGGIEYVAVGVELGVLNQYRTMGFPTVVVGGELRFSVSEPMRACRNSEPCWSPSDEVRRVAVVAPPSEDPPVDMESANAEPDESPPVSEISSFDRAPGVGRGTTGLELHIRSSQRIGRVEPYLGVGLQVEFPTGESDFSDSEAPPWKGELVLGVEVIPWEAVASFQRLSIDWRLTGIFVSEGLDYSEVFDALGSSRSKTYRESSSIAPPTVSGGGSADGYTTGLTQVEAHGAFRFGTEAHWRVGRYVEFDVGGELAFTQGHVLTLGGDSYRQETDLPGQRFLLGTARSLSGWVRSKVLF